jgi:hypothetical protein
MLEITGLISGAVAVRLARAQPSRLLRAAILAQSADLVLFAFIWQNSLAAEQNPLANLVHVSVQSMIGPDSGLAPFVSILVLIGIKLGLILYLAWAAPVLGRYRQPVLLVAAAAGVVGALSNFIALPLFQGPGA